MASETMSKGMRATLLQIARDKTAEANALATGVTRGPETWMYQDILNHEAAALREAVRSHEALLAENKALLEEIERMRAEGLGAYKILNLYAVEGGKFAALLAPVEKPTHHRDTENAEEGGGE